MKFGHIELIVTEPLKSMEWYIDFLGFELIANQGDRFIWIQKSGTEILLKPGNPVVSQTYETAANIVLYSNDLQNDVRFLKNKGLKLYRDNSCFFFSDPDGNWFQLVDPEGDHSE